MEPQIFAAIIVAAATVLAALVGHWFGRRPPKQDPRDSSSPYAKRRSHRYDVFVSAPLAAFDSDDEIKEDHDKVAAVVNYLENTLGYHVYWAGRKIEQRADFDDGSLSAHDDVEAIRDSRCFLLLYPKPIASSVLFEAGIALQNCLVSIYIAPARENLPFLMRHAAEAFNNVKICESTLPDETIRLFTQRGKDFFEQLKQKSRQ
ncbi:hypothetical protein [Marinobacter adhaerens]|uniref:hypothetical protein n=1 Tax=Marinobacter adhaerens TaxID=1033846 RepID=UPI003F71D27B